MLISIHLCYTFASIFQQTVEPDRDGVNILVEVLSDTEMKLGINFSVRKFGMHVSELCMEICVMLGTHTAQISTHPA